MKTSILICLLFLSGFSYSQSNKIDSLNRLIAKATSDTQRINLTVAKIKLLWSINLDSAIVLSNKTIAETKHLNYRKGEANVRIALASVYCFKGNYIAAKENLDSSKQILNEVKDVSALPNMYDSYGVMYSMQNKFDTSHLFYEKAIAAATLKNDKSILSTIFQNNAIAYQQQSNYPQALLYYQKALKISEQLNDEDGEAYIYLNIAITYNTLDDTARAEQSYFKAVNLAKKLNLKNVEAYAYANLSALYADKKQFAEQYSFGIKAAALGKQMGDAGIEASSLSRAALALANQNKFNEAESLNRQSMAIADSSKQPYNIYQAYSGMGHILTMEKEYKKAIPFFEKAFHSLTDADLYDEEVGNSYFDLSECYEKTGAFNKALAAYKTSAKIADSVKGKENVKRATELTMNYEFEKKQQVAKVEQERKDAVAQKIKNQQYFIITALAILILAVLIIVLIQFRNNRQKHKANLLLERQKQKVETTLSELKSTQAQLIQSEKMASLGELTAGIAHEIQNPLNFVNNFSDLNKELLEELKDEADKGNIDEVKAIASDVIENEEKINHHGKRAGAIVKGMLQHSRANTGKKEPTDINALADEYLRLSYHGLRAKDKNFNADFKTDFDESIGKIHVVPQDVGRVLLNLFNNSFYAVNEKKKLSEISYKPSVSVQTKRLNDKVEIIVSDNGNGIPKHIVDKIFQPFFTTKPTGQGTGLGLSLSYDIIKAHGGELKVETKEGEGAVFIFSLPLNKLN